MKLSLGSELLRLATVLAVPGALAFVFPYAAVGFRAASPDAGPASTVAFVRLDAESEKDAIKSAKSSVRGESARMQRLRAELSFGELPEDPMATIVPLPTRLDIPAPRPVEFGVPVYRPSQAAAVPTPIARAKELPEKPAFSREELLKIE